MIKSDWNVFRAKFSGNLQLHFEWMCYLLFCNEHGKRTGIFRYKNQSAIETDPIEFDAKCIGWQAKYYETPLSKHKDEILMMLSKVSRDYPEVGTVYFYTNSEWGQYRGKEPTGKKEIEEEAVRLGIEIEWRCGSYFESPFVVDQCKRLISHFFIDSDDVFELLDSLEAHSENLLKDIDTEIQFLGQCVILDRDQISREILSSNRQAVVVSGDGGTGKTALVKSLYQNRPEGAAFYIHKATEFSVDDTRMLLRGVSLADFVDAHEGIEYKVLVVDSAEGLLGIDNIEPLKEYISTLVNSGWRIWFTTRNNYLDDLLFQLLEIYKIEYQLVSIPPMSSDELISLSSKYEFRIPQDRTLAELIAIPFYLKEYLSRHDANSNLNYMEFRSSLWPRVISKSRPHRERVFISMAVNRASSGHFFVPLSGSQPDDAVAQELEQDGVLSYESPHGYFITHDIYEEWALEKHLEALFATSATAANFLSNLEPALPIRRAFRKWMSEQLGMHNQDIISLFHEVYASNEIPKIWLDELLISVLLSDFAAFFFKSYEKQLLSDDGRLLRKLSLLIRLGCKEVDGELHARIGWSASDLLSMEYVFTKPKGIGWEALIQFLHDKHQEVGDEGIGAYIPVLHDWNSYSRKGATTRQCSYLALRYYRWTMSVETYSRDDELSEKVTTTILNGVEEVRDEISTIIDDVVSHDWSTRRDPYHSLSTAMLTKVECYQVARAIPKEVIRLANVFWQAIPRSDGGYSSYSHREVDEYFGLRHDLRLYHPPSSLQTPIFILLDADFYSTLDFIIEFTNAATEKYANSSLDQGEVSSVNVTLNDGRTISHYISPRLWCVYRGTQVNPDILECVHMSLERFLLERGKNTSSEVLGHILVRILENTISASLASLVSSIVAAFPEKTFEAAKVLFRTKEFFIHDTGRYVLDQSHKTQLTSLQSNFGGGSNLAHENDRITACDHPHRKYSLEHMLLQYQFFRREETSDAEAEDRIEEINKILDDHYAALPASDAEDEEDKVWRLYLARMDRRKMNPVSRKTDEGVVIEFNPELDEELKEYSEQALEESSEPYQHISLLLWADARLFDRNGYEKYEDYESNPLGALEEAKAVWAMLHSEVESESSLINWPLPSKVCAVLLRDFEDQLEAPDLEVCREIILFYATLFLQPDYQHQISDGSMPALSVLPLLRSHFPADVGSIRRIMVMSLMRQENMDLAGTRFNSITIDAIQAVWSEDFSFALSIYLGYLILAPMKDAALEEFRERKYEEGGFGFDMHEFWLEFAESRSEVLERIDDGSIVDLPISTVSSNDVELLTTAFLISPLPNICDSPIPHIETIAATVLKELLSDDRGERLDYTTRNLFIGKYARSVLGLPTDEIENALAPFLDNFVLCEGAAELIREFVHAEDFMNRPVQFWRVWYLLREKVTGCVNAEGGRRDADDIIESYMFARNPWKKSAKEWHTFSAENAIFFRDLSSEMVGNPAYLYSLAKFLCGIGSAYLEEGIQWLSSVLSSISNLPKNNRENTIYYLEKAVRRYLYLYRAKSRRNAKTKEAVLSILDFLVEENSVLGYMLRENAA